MSHRTRIKICGITRPEFAEFAASAGADAIGLVFYPRSPRCVGLGSAAEICRSLPAFVTAVGLFVNSSRDLVRSVIESVPIQLLQFHGDEVEEQCCSYGLPYIKAVRTMPGVDLLECALSFPTAQGLLLDAPVEGFGGGGKTFDWSLIPAQLPLPLVLAGGLSPDNLARAVAQVRP